MTDSDLRVNNRGAATTPHPRDTGPTAGERRRGRDRSGSRRPGTAGAAATRTRTSGGGAHGAEVEPVAVAGLLDIVDDQAWLRTNGYLPAPGDVHVSAAQVRGHGLRRGDAVTGTARCTADDQPRTQGRRGANTLLRVDEINGMEPEQARRRPEFYKLTPLYPQDRLRLETEPHILTTRVIDLVMPLGKGQRALIV
ncbi:MAG TPA: transcription termination factor Rho, partial [Catenuloplanes sp.]